MVCTLYKKNFFTYLFLAVLVLFCHMGFSLVSGKGGYSLVAVLRLLIAVASRDAEHRQALGRVDLVVVILGRYSTGSVVVAHGLSCSPACGSSRTGNHIHVCCIGRRILYH